MMSSRPSQNDGVEMPISTRKVSTRSVQPNWCTAAAIPAISPKIEQSTSAAPARIRVAPNRSNTSSATGRFSE